MKKNTFETKFILKLKTNVFGFSQEKNSENLITLQKEFLPENIGFDTTASGVTRRSILTIHTTKDEMLRFFERSSFKTIKNSQKLHMVLEVIKVKNISFLWD